MAVCQNVLYLKEFSDRILHLCQLNYLTALAICNISQLCACCYRYGWKTFTAYASPHGSLHLIHHPPLFAHSVRFRRHLRKGGIRQSCRPQRLFRELFGSQSIYSVSPPSLIFRQRILRRFTVGLSDPARLGELCYTRQPCHS